MKKNIFTFMAFAAVMCCMVVGANAQPKYVKGGVFDKVTGDPLVGVSVQLEGTTVGVFTDVDGYYGITCQPSDVLVFSFAGYETQKHQVGNIVGLSIEMEEEYDSVTARLGWTDFSGVITFFQVKKEVLFATNTPENPEMFSYRKDEIKLESMLEITKA